MNTLFNWFCNPLVHVAIFFLMVLYFRFKKNERAMVRWLFIGIGWLAVASISPLPQWMIYSLEHRQGPIKMEWVASDSPTYILVLGSGHINSPALPASMQLTGTGLLRLAEGIRIHRQLPESKIVCSGYTASNRTSQAEMLANAAIELGVSPSDTLQVREPANTFAEVTSFKKRFGNAVPIIVTSASHMPRAMLICEKVGLKAIPAPTDYLVKDDSLAAKFDFYPSGNKIGMMERALHEYAGMLQLKTNLR
jgi:uncharacterized SAM-binding protein YcdF (DUF218 family)